MDMIFRQLLDGPTSTLTYLLADSKTREAVLIDSVFEQHLRDLALVRELDLTLLCTLETHVHADHITGAWLMKAAMGSHIGVPRDGGADGADRYLGHGDQVAFGSCVLQVRATPGHTDGCVTYVLSDQSMAFTGDTLLIRGAGRTDFQQGDPHRLYQSVREQIFSLARDCCLFPAHDYNGRTVTSVGEERQHNPRLGDHVREEDFVGYMNNLGLPHPKRMAQAVPANLVCGRPEDDAFPKPPDWGPVTRTFAGVWQVEPEWVHQHSSELCLIDVREEAEAAASPMGLLAGSKVIPLSVLRNRIDEIPRDCPTVTICPTGARSAFAATILEKSGVRKVANMRGGILEWRGLSFPITSPSENSG